MKWKMPRRYHVMKPHIWVSSSALKLWAVRFAKQKAYTALANFALESKLCLPNGLGSRSFRSRFSRVILNFASFNILPSILTVVLFSYFIITMIWALWILNLLRRTSIESQSITSSRSSDIGLRAMTLLDSASSPGKILTHSEAEQLRSEAEQRRQNQQQEAQMRIQSIHSRMAALVRYWFSVLSLRFLLAMIQSACCLVWYKPCLLETNGIHIFPF